MNGRTPLATAVALTGIALFSAMRLAPAQESASATVTQICGEYDAYFVRKLDSEEQEDFCEAHRNKVTLVVNTASRCGYTYQYDTWKSSILNTGSAGLWWLVSLPTISAIRNPARRKALSRFADSPMA